MEKTISTFQLYTISPFHFSTSAPFDQVKEAHSMKNSHVWNPPHGSPPHFLPLSFLLLILTTFPSTSSTGRAPGEPWQGELHCRHPNRAQPGSSSNSSYTLSSVTHPPGHPVTLSASHHVTQPPCHPVILSPRHPVTMSPSHDVTLSHSHPVTQPPCHPVILSPRHPVTQGCQVVGADPIGYAPLY